MVITNDKWARPAYHTTLSDILYDPWNRPVSTRSWPLGTLEPGDQLTLTYTAEFDALKTKPGTYRNVGRITGQRNETMYAPMISKMPASEGWGDVTFAGGKVLGAATEAAASPAPAPLASAVCAPLITTNIRLGIRNDPNEVKKLQQFLNTDPDTQVARSGVGSLGFESTIFGPLSRNAVNAFQRKYASEILAPLGISAPTGAVYASTREKINALSCGGVGPSAAASSPTQSTEVAQASAAAQTAPSPKPKATAKPKTQSGTNAAPETDTRGAGKFSVSGNDVLGSVGSWFSKFAPKNE